MMNKKKQFILNQKINETFATFEFLLEDEEKAHFKSLVAKAENSDKVNDRKELYQEIQKLLLRTNFLKRNELQDKLFALEDDFHACANSGFRQFNKTIARDGGSAKAKNLDKINTVITDLQHRKQAYENAYATFEKAQMVPDKADTQEWQQKYCRWVQGETAAIHDVVDRLEPQFDTFFNDKDFWDSTLTMVKTGVGIPLAVLGLLVGATQYVIKAPFVLASKLSPSNKKERETLPTMVESLQQITKTLPVKEKDKQPIGEPVPTFYLVRDRLGEHYSTEPKDYYQEHTKVLQGMENKINAFEQLRTNTLNQFTSEAKNQKSKFIMPHLPSRKPIERSDDIPHELDERRKD